MTNTTKWFRWDGQFDFQGGCNLRHHSGGRILKGQQAICLDPRRTQAIPIVSQTLQVKPVTIKWEQGTLWAQFQFTSPERIRAILMRITDANAACRDLLYQEVIEGEMLDLLPDEISAKDQTDPQDQPLAFDFSLHQPKVALWVTTHAEDFEQQRQGCRYLPVFQPGRCISHETPNPVLFPKKISSPMARPVETVDAPSQPTQWTTSRGSSTNVSCPWQAWESPNPALTEMVRRPDEDPDNTVIQAMAEGHLWSAWEAPGLPQAQKQPPTPQPEPVTPKVETKPLDDPWAKQHAPVYPKLDVPGPCAVQLKQGDCGIGFRVCALSSASTAPQPQNAVPAVLVRGVRGTVCVDGLHFTELYNYDDPDHLFKSVSFLHRHYFDAPLDPVALRQTTLNLLRALLSDSSTSPLLEAIPEHMASSGADASTRASRYLELAEQDDYRGDSLMIVVLGLWLGVEMRLYEPDGTPINLPLYDRRNHFHCFHLVRRQRPDSNKRYAPLTRQIPDLTNSSPIPYEISGAEVEAFYRDATLSPHRRLSAGGTLLQRVTKFYRHSDYRLITTADKDS